MVLCYNLDNMVRVNKEGWEVAKNRITGEYQFNPRSSVKGGRPGVDYGISDFFLDFRVRLDKPAQKKKPSGIGLREFENSRGGLGEHPADE